MVTTTCRPLADSTSTVHVSAEYSPEPELHLRTVTIDNHTDRAIFDFDLHKTIVTHSGMILHCSTLETPIFHDIVFEQFRLAVYCELYWHGVLSNLRVAALHNNRGATLSHSSVNVSSQ